MDGEISTGVNKKQILLVADHFYPYHGGLETFCLQVAKRLSDENTKVCVLTYQYEESLPLQQTHEGIEIYRVPCRNLLSHVYHLPKLWNEHTQKTIAHLSSQKWDAVITNTRFFTSCLLGRKVARKSKSKLIHIEHGNRHVVHPNPIVALGAYLYDLVFGRLIISGADIVVTISQKGVDFVKKLGAKKTAIVYNSIDTKEYVAVSDSDYVALREKHKIKVDDFVILFVGRLIEPKGVQHVIRVLNQVPNAKFIVIGDGPYRKELEAMSAGKSVDFVGFADSTIVRQYLSFANCFVNPSYSEGLPTSILEAGSIGVPVVATDVGGTREIIPDIRYGILVKPRDEQGLLHALQVVQKNKALVKSMTAHLNSRVKAVFDWDVSISKLRDLIFK